MRSSSEYLVHVIRENEKTHALTIGSSSFSQKLDRELMVTVCDKHCVAQYYVQVLDEIFYLCLTVVLLWFLE